MSLRIRLSIIVSLIFLTGMVLGVSFLISNAKQRVAEEVESTATLTFQLLDSLLSNANNSLITQDKSVLLQSLLAIEDARHMNISIESSDSTIPDDSFPGLDIEAPSWFVRLVQSETLEFRKPIGDFSQEVIIIRTNPADEIAEVWLESRNFMIVLLMVLLVINSILYITVGRWFQPVKMIVGGLENVEQGDFSGHISQTSLPELKAISDKLNQLTKVLRTSKNENDRLRERSISIQEEERRHLAQELHDEMGQSISAIKAIAFSISERTENIDEMSSQGAKNIGSISNHVRDHVRSMMLRLRPSILDELGLVPALEHMVDEWNDHHKDVFCKLEIEGEFEELDANQRINIYRIIQEALTNVAKHAEATEVEIQLSKNEEFHLSIKDNGRGFNPETNQKGMGFIGIKERVQALGGNLDIVAAPEEGARLEIEFFISKEIGFE